MPQLNSRRGSAILLIGLTFAMLAGIAGAAVDYGRGLLLKSELRNALDAAALAGGTVATSANRNTVIQKYFDVNFPAGYMGSTVSPLSISIDAANSVLTVSASATLNYSLFKVTKIGGNISAAGSTQVTLLKRGLELALVMDNTGSMNGANFQSMRAAALLLIDTLYGSNETVPNLYVSLVPYTASVNIGSGNAALTTGVTASNYSPSSWKGCVATRNNSAGANNEMSENYVSAADGYWAPYLYPSAYENNGSGTPDNCWSSTGTGCTSGIFTDSSSATGFSTATGSDNGSTNSTFSVTNTSSYKINPNQMGKNNGRGPNLGCGTPITPLIQSKTSIKAAINMMDSWHRGGTLSDIGLAWGWRTISQKWQGKWPGAVSNTLPLNYGTPLMDKVIIILTDGDNGFYQNNYTAYGRNHLPSSSSTANNIFNTTNAGTITSSVNTRLTNLCTAIKAKGVIIYSITYTGSANSQIQDLFQGCASNDAYYFNAPTNSDISAVFQQIGDSLNNLRISQ